MVIYSDLPIWQWKIYHFKLMFQFKPYLPSGKHTKNYGKSPSSTGKSSISMAIFNSYVKLPEGSGIVMGL